MNISAINEVSNYSSYDLKRVKKSNPDEKTCSTRIDTIKTSVQDEIKAAIPGVNIDIRQMPTADADRKAYAFACVDQGFSKNITVPQNVLDKMEKNPQFRQKVLNNLKKEFSQVFPQIPGMKLLSHGAVVDEDGNVSGWAVGGPDGTRKNRKWEGLWFEMEKCRKEQEQLTRAAFQRRQLAELRNEQVIQINLQNVTTTYQRNLLCL